MSLYLQPDVMLALRDGNVVLERTDVPVSHVLGIAETVALSCLAATGDKASASALCGRLLPEGSQWLDRVIQRYWTYLGDGPIRPLNSQWLEAIAKMKPLFPILPSSTIKRAGCGAHRSV